MSSPSYQDRQFCDWYEVLQVAPDASTDEVRRAWRRMAQQTHPDRHPDDPAAAARFIQVQQAMGVLGDRARRLVFDRDRAIYMARQASTAPPLSPAAPSFSFRQWWQDIRDRRRDVAPLPQADHASVVLRLPLAAVFSNTEHVIGLRVARSCPTCGGSRSNCQVCLGTGQRLVAGRWRVRVPAGTTDGIVLRLPRQGHQGPRFGAPGDILVEVAWTRRGIWRWRNGMLVGRLRVSARTLKYGARLRLRAPDGAWGWLIIQPGPSQARMLRLPGIGLPDEYGQRGPAFIECYSGARHLKMNLSSITPSTTVLSSL